jgi:hypothetical protein
MKIYFNSKSFEEEFSIDVESDCTIFNIKELLEKTIKIFASDQRFFFEGKSLKDDKTLSYYNIQENSCIGFTICCPIIEYEGEPLKKSLEKGK